LADTGSADVALNSMRLAIFKGVMVGVGQRRFVVGNRRTP